MAERADPYRQLRFVLEIDGLVAAGFSQCDLPAASSGVVEYREGNEPPTPRKLPGLNTYGPLVLETGVTDRSVELFEWRTQVEQGEMAEARRAAAVTLLDATGEPAARWVFREAWPARYEAPRLSAMADEVAVERLVVAHEGFGRVDLDRMSEDEADAESTLRLPTGELPRGVGVPQGIERLLGTDRLPERSGDEESEQT